jgi:hypothetical protein
MLGGLLAKERRVMAVNREPMANLGVVLECMFRLVPLEE